jgi:YidC/Oxa1 family membrane protein insertase
MPFLYGLYFSLYTALLANRGESAASHLTRANRDIYPFLPHLSALPDTHFLWTNLAHPDPLHILPILAGVLTFVQLRMALPVRAQTAGTKQSDPNAQAMGTMQYMMPLITLFIGWTFPSGLAFYWVISTAFSAAQQYFLTGLGSLFVGIPGMEHLVPEPTTPAPASAVRPRAASAIVDSTPAATRPTGMAGLRQLLAEMTASRAQPADDRATADGTGPSGRGGVGGASQQPQTRSVSATAKKMEDGAEATGSLPPESARRLRPARQGPTLVKPNTQSSSTALNGNGASPTSDAGNGHASQSANGALDNASGASARTDKGAVDPVRGAGPRDMNENGTRPARPASSQQRKPSGGSTARKRPNGKPKGGR